MDTTRLSALIGEIRDCSLDPAGNGVAAKVQIAHLGHHLDLHARDFFVSDAYDLK